MIRQKTPQGSVCDAFVNTNNYHNHLLEQVDALIEWKPLQQRIERLYKHRNFGRPAFPAITMFKVLLLQSWYNLSDPAAEDALSDRLSFRRFTNLSLEDKVPDHSTIHRFRDRIAPIADKLFSDVNRQLEKKNLILRKGTLVDATLIESAGRPKSGDDTPSDSDARWGGSERRQTYGYKGHIGLDQDSEIIRKAEITPANIHDSKMFEPMISGDEKMAYADKAYHSSARSTWLKEHGISNGILRRAARNNPLTPNQQARNRSLTAVRQSVEHVFGTFKRLYQWRRCRYYTLDRNRCSFLVLCTSYNLKRMLKLQAI